MNPAAPVTSKRMRGSLSGAQQRSARRSTSPGSGRLPDQAGDALTFKALQTYARGEVARWIGAEDSTTPLLPSQLPRPPPASTVPPRARLLLRAPAGGAHLATTSDDGSSNGLAIVALMVGALGLLAGVASLLATRRGRTAS